MARPKHQEPSSPAPHEIEVKLRVADMGAFARRLKALGAKRLGRVHEMNTLYDTPRGRFRKRGHLLRLRVLTPADGATTRHGGASAGPRALLTFKGPSLRLEEANGPRGSGGPGGQRYKVRRELEVALDDPGPARAILEALGLVRAFRYEKFRTSYAVPRHSGVKLELDETPIGTFAEIEGPPRSIDRLARRLGYSPKDYITLSYLGLHLDNCRRRGLPPRDMVFSGRRGESARRGKSKK